MIELCHGEIAVMCGAIIPNVPHKKGVNDFGIVLHEGFEIKDVVVVEYHRNHDVAQGRCITLQVFDGIGVGVKHIRVA